MAIINDNWMYTPTVTTAGTGYMNRQLIRVNGIASARAYPTLPNSMIALFDENDDIMYIKTTDASNYPTVRKFRFVEEIEKPVDTSKFVTADEFNELKQMITDLRKEISNGKQSVRTESEKYTLV